MGYISLFWRAGASAVVGAGVDAGSRPGKGWTERWHKSSPKGLTVDDAGAGAVSLRCRCGCVCLTWGKVETKGTSGC